MKLVKSDFKGTVMFLLLSFLSACSGTDNSTPVEQANEAFDQGIYYFYQKEDKNGSLPYFTKAIELNPSFSKAYHMRGLVYSHFDQYDESIRDFDLAIKYDPKLTKAYFDRGILLLNFHKKEKACLDFKKAAEFGDSTAIVYYKKYCEGDLQ
jgi:tetratricopeptide (TPR) repeat protein